MIIIAKLAVGQQKHLFNNRPVRRVRFNEKKLTLNSTKNNFLESSGSCY